MPEEYDDTNEKKQRKAERDRQRYLERKEANLCVVCGKNPPAPDMDTCEPCLVKRRELAKRPDIKERKNAHKRAKAAEKAAKGICTEDGCNEPALPNRKKCEKHRAKDRKKEQRKHKKLRDKTLEKCGGIKCSCLGCACEFYDFLQLDHINNDGNAHRRRLGGKQQLGGHKILYDLQKTEHPEQIVQTMCANCNYGKSRHGKCPLAGTPHNINFTGEYSAA